MKLNPIPTFAVVLWTACVAQAQYTPYSSRPVSQARLSPYLNLVRNQNFFGSEAANYFLGVVPERERRSLNSITANQIQSIEQELSLRPSYIPAAPTSDLPVPPVPVAGRPLGSRPSSAYFRGDQQSPSNRGYGNAVPRSNR